MRRGLAALMFAATVGLVTLSQPPQRAAAQPPGPVAETFRTPDGVELHALFHATQKTPGVAPVVVFMYPPGPDRDMTKGDWGSLAKKLNEEGDHVLQFDWRGHGKSTSIKDKDKFWKNLYLNQYNANGVNVGLNGNIKSAPRNPPVPNVPIKNDIFYKDLVALNPKAPEKYMAAYVNDLAGVRFYLDTKNDNKELNSSSIYIVGAGDAAALGMAWMTAEWNRPAVFPNVSLLGVGVPTYEYVPQRLFGEFAEAGADFGGAVWLTAARPERFPLGRMQQWIAPGPNPPRGIMSAPKLRENNPMLFLFAEKDVNGTNSGRAQSEVFYHQILVAEPKKGSALEKLEQTFIKDVKGADGMLQGVKLLGQNATLKTEDTIVQYFAAIQKVRAKYPSKARKYEASYFIDVRYLGLAP